VCAGSAGRSAAALEPYKNAVEINLALVSCTPNGRFSFKYAVKMDDKSTFSVQIVPGQPQPAKAARQASQACQWIPPSCLQMPPDAHHRQDSTARIPQLGFQSQDSTARIPQPGFHSQDSPARIPQPGFHSQDTTARIPQPGFHSQDPRVRIPQPGFHSQDSPVRIP
jgi:hypothetical protein